jgi:MoaA/NifB/PqqE/SkfB family radical SAM enzyme
MLGLIGNLSTLGVHELRITGGEPTTRPDLLELIDAAVSAGLYVSLGSNGVWPKGLAGKLISRPIGRYLISLEGDRLVNDALRGRGAFDRTLESIDQLVTAGRSVRVNTMLTRITLGHLEETAALCAAHQVRHMALIPPRPAGRAGRADAQTIRNGAGGATGRPNPSSIWRRDRI